jgi:hypothetical protein
MATPTSPSEAQAEQDRLLKEALKRPGVAAALAVYESVQKYVPAPAAPPRSVSYSTGGNTR